MRARHSTGARSALLSGRAVVVPHGPAQQNLGRSKLGRMATVAKPRGWFGPGYSRPVFAMSWPAMPLSFQ
jgi:hypothetical protein